MSAEQQFPSPLVHDVQALERRIKELEETVEANRKHAEDDQLYFDESRRHQARLLQFVVRQCRVDMSFYDHYVRSHHPPGSRYGTEREATETAPVLAVTPVVDTKPASLPAPPARKRADEPASSSASSDASKRRRLADSSAATPGRRFSSAGDNACNKSDENSDTDDYAAWERDPAPIDSARAAPC